MFLKISYANDEEKESIILEHKNLYIIEQAELLTEKYLVFSDKIYTSITDELTNKISTLETENKTLKEELTVTQDAINELILNSMSL